MGSRSPPRGGAASQSEGAGGTGPKSATPASPGGDGNPRGNVMEATEPTCPGTGRVRVRGPRAGAVAGATAGDITGDTQSSGQRCGQRCEKLREGGHPGGGAGAGGPGATCRTRRPTRRQRGGGEGAVVGAVGASPVPGGEGPFAPQRGPCSVENNANAARATGAEGTWVFRAETAQSAWARPAVARTRDSEKGSRSRAGAPSSAVACFPDRDRDVLPDAD